MHIPALSRPPAPPQTTPAAASEPTNRHVMPESHKHQQERSITNRSGQQYPGEIAAGGHAIPEGLSGADTQVRSLRESSPHTTKTDARKYY
ncbi:MAG: hypothetical protein KAS74_00515 [Methanosarcinales archaeon]|nr:hypothetical protein [Methanosarcinales archaeon]